ncbi:MAG: PilT protein domain protein [Acidobacteria bacterium]|nr:PilT protein domain protein [Acidobacteriota bacterium]
MLLVEFARLPLKRFPHAPLIARIWQLRHNLTAYDAAYVTLAEQRDATLITRDARMARSSGHEARIEYVE